MTTGQVVDTETAQEFMTQTLEKASRAELGGIIGALEKKSAHFTALLSPETLPTLTHEQLRFILRSIFATRRKADTILDVMSVEGLRTSFGYLLYDPASLSERFRGFVDCLSGYWSDVRLARKTPPGKEEADFPENILCDLAAEILHFTEPDARWLWTRWMWDPKARTGALPLVTYEDYDISGATAGDIYMQVGRGVAFVHQVGESAGFQTISRTIFDTDVFLGCVYVVYVYTVLRMRMTQEFNKVMPGLPEFLRRLLGVYEKDGNVGAAVAGLGAVV